MRFGRFVESVRRLLDQGRLGVSKEKRRGRRPSYRPSLEALERRDVPSGGTWTPLNNVDPTGQGTSSMMLLPNGTVMVQQAGFSTGGVSNAWDLLSPDASGSYINGNWSTLAPMNVARLYYASDVLQNANVYVMGGEYSGNPYSDNETNSAEIYNPGANTWTNVSPLPDSDGGDDPSELLPNGNVLLGSIDSANTYIYNPSSDSYTQSGSILQGTSTENTWVKLPNGDILSYDTLSSAYASGPPTTAEYYDPNTGTWTATGTVPVQLTTSEVELGPGFLLPNGKVLQIGSNGKTALYNYQTNTWTAGPTYSNGTIGADDAPGVLLPSGDVIFAADTPNYNAPTELFDYNASTNKITQLTGLPTGLQNDLQGDPSFVCRMALLPTGQLLMSAGYDDLYIYTPSGSAPSTSQPTITGIVNNGTNFTLTGTKLNGMSEGSSYGDDVQNAENFPIVRLTNSAGVVSYATSVNWSNTGVQTGSAPVTTQFTNTQGPGAYLLSVSAAGISSNNVLFVQMGPGADDITLRKDATITTDIDVVQGSNTLLGQFALTSFKSIYVAGDPGDDTLTLDTSNGTFLSSGGLKYDGGGGSDTLVGPNSGNTWNISGNDSGSLNTTTTFTNIENLVGGTGSDTFKFTTSAGQITGSANGGAGSNSLNFSGDGGVPVTVNLQTDSAAQVAGFSNIQTLTGSSSPGDTLIGPNTVNTWSITGVNAGKVGTLAFSGMENLVGGTNLDTFKFSFAGRVNSITGGGAPSGQGDWLDYSAFTSAEPISVNLAAGTASNVTGSIAGIQNVIGGAGADTLTGDSQGNILIEHGGAGIINGGTGRSLLIGGSGATTVNGGSGGDLMIGGKTSYDTTNHVDLMIILAEWQSSDSYTTRTHEITHGTIPGHSGVKLAIGSGATVTNNASTVAEYLNGFPSVTDLDWFFASSASQYSALETVGGVQEIVNNAP